MTVFGVAQECFIFVLRVTKLLFHIGDDNGTFVIDLTSFSPGQHSLIVRATSGEGEEAAAEIIFISVQGKYII